MLKKMPIRLRLTALSVLLLTLCCVGLTGVLNFSANKMANVIEATPVTPATAIGADGTPTDAAPGTMGMVPMMPSENSQAARSAFFVQSLFAMALVIVVGGGLTYLIAGKALRPLQELSSQMKNRTVHNLSERLPVPESRDEIADLTVSFNEMSTKLGDIFAMQKRFSQSAAHELRTPLTVLKTKVDVFKKRTDHTAADYDKLLTVITDQTNRLSDLVKDLLDLANMDALNCDEQIGLKLLLCGVSEELSPLAAEKGITITIAGEALDILGNESLLHRAFYNLIENAIKYNTPNGTIAIAVSCGEAQGKVTIADTGLGIPAEMRTLIFEPFFRIDKSRSRKMGGAGLGLATVKAIVEKHHGQIAVLENSMGGTIFEITL